MVMVFVLCFIQQISLPSRIGIIMYILLIIYNAIVANVLIWPLYKDNRTTPKKIIIYMNLYSSLLELEHVCNVNEPSHARCSGTKSLVVKVLHYTGKKSSKTK